MKHLHSVHALVCSVLVIENRNGNNTFCRLFWCEAIATGFAAARHLNDVPHLRRQCVCLCVRWCWCRQCDDLLGIALHRHTMPSFGGSILSTNSTNKAPPISVTLSSASLFGLHYHCTPTRAHTKSRLKQIQFKFACYWHACTFFPCWLRFRLTLAGSKPSQFHVCAFAVS